MGEDYTIDDELLIPMLTSPDASLRERGWRIVLWKYGLDLRKYIISLLHARRMPTHLWEDIAQKTYSTAIELFASKGYKGQPLLPWLCRIAKNHASNAYRREQTRTRRTVPLDPENEALDLDPSADDEARFASPETVLLSELAEQSQAAAYQQARTSLSDDERRLLDALVQNPGQSIAELADRLGEHPKTVRNKKSLLLKRLKTLIDYFQQKRSGGEDHD